MKARTERPTNRPQKPGPYTPRATQPAPGRNGKPAPPERVNAAGLIHVAQGELLANIPLFYYAERSRWYGPNRQGGWGHFADAQAKSLVAEYGFHKALKDDQGNTPAERAMLWLIQNHAVAYAGPLAGYRAGVHEVNGSRILITENPRWIVPKPGDWPTIRELVTTLFADTQHDQTNVFLLWLAESFRAFFQRMTTTGPWPFRYCPALAMFGPRGCGKTALIDLVLTPLLGGRRADPMNYLRERRFNKDLFAGALLVLDDKGAAAHLAERRERGEAIKDLIWKEEQRMEGKGADALMLRPLWRLVIAGNDDDAGLQVCPALSPSLEDKLLLLRVARAEGLPSNEAANLAWAAALRAELPAFAAYLVDWHPPDTLTLDPRTRVANLWHPELVAALRDLQPEMRLLELIDGLGLLQGVPHWEGSATDFERAMRSKDGQDVLTRVFVTSTSAGRLLSELARMVPERVEKKNWGGTTHYRIFPPRRPE